LTFLDAWSQDWSGAEMKAALSQTAFCGAVHLHGNPDNRLLADLDCNGWPQTGRNKALRAIRRGWAPHICGDQHLAVVVHHGIDAPSDGPFAFTSPAIVNTIYGRWWHPIDEQPGENPVQGSPLPWTGEFQDGLGNFIRMIAYANPEDRTDETKRADGHGIARFDKRDRSITFECWPRFSSVDDGDSAQFAGWPITFKMRHNDGRSVAGYLPRLTFPERRSAVVQVIHQDSGEVVYTVRSRTNEFRPPIYQEGTYTINVGGDRPDARTLEDVPSGGLNDRRTQTIRW
jgi:hypothetical protein